MELVLSLYHVGPELMCTVSNCICWTVSQADDAGTEASLLPTASRSQVVFLSVFQQKLYKIFLKLGGMRNMFKKRTNINKGKD